MKTTTFLLFACAFSLAVHAQTLNKTDKIRKLLEMTGSGKLGVQVATNIISIYKETYTNVDQAFWDEMTKEIKAGDLVELIVPIYDKHFTESDIDQVIRFYETPAGKKMISNLPVITQESMEAGQGWGKRMGEKVMARLKEKGYIDK